MKKATEKFSLNDILILGLILVVALVMRLYDFDKPLTDYHSWRQADTAAVARNFTRNGFNLLKPTFDDVSPIQSGIDNPQGYRFVEFPLYNAIVAFFYKLFPFFEVHVWGRLVSAVSSLAIIALIYYFLKEEVDRKAAIAGAATYATFPFFVFFSRVVLPETMATMFAFASIFFLYKNTFQEKEPQTNSWTYVVLAAICFALALLIKPTVIFFAIVHLYLFIKKFRYSLLKNPAPYLFALLALPPLIAWRLYIRAYPEGVPGSEWLFTSVNTAQGLQNIFFKPAFFRWIFFERINNIILGGFAAAFLIIGGFVKPKRLFLFSILAASGLYVFTFQGGNVQHEYYQTLILPAIALFVGVGISFILNSPKSFISLYVLYPVIVGIMLFSLLMSYYRVKDFYSYSGDLPTIARVIRTLTSPTDRIVTDSTGDTTLLYLADRKGSPAVYKDLHELKKSGYSYFVTMNGQVIEQVKLVPDFHVVFENDKFALFKL